MAARVNRATPRRTQADRRAETERRVLEAATRLVAEHGAQRLSLRDIGAESGYSRGIVNHHFGTREQLLKALLVHLQQSFALPETEATGLELLALTVATYIDHLHDRSPRGQAFLLLWAEAIGTQGPLRAMFDERDSWFRSLLAAHVKQGIEEGSIRADADPAAAAVSILGMLRGIGLQLMLTPGCANPTEIRDEAVRTVRNGLSPTRTG